MGNNPYFCYWFKMGSTHIYSLFLLGLNCKLYKGIQKVLYQKPYREQRISATSEFLEDKVHGTTPNERSYSPGYAWRVLQKTRKPPYVLELGRGWRVREVSRVKRRQRTVKICI